MFFNEKFGEINAQSPTIDTFLEVKIDDNANQFYEYESPNGIKDLKIEVSTEESCLLSFVRNDLHIRYLVELRLSHRLQPMARCNCLTGRRNARCEHLLRAFHLYFLLESLGLVKTLVVKSPYLWIPYDWQNT